MIVIARYLFVCTVVCVIGSARFSVAGIKTFLYLHCIDLEAARRFYTDILGLNEVYFSAEDGTVGYQVGTLQITVAAHPGAVAVDGWSRQLGWEGGTVATPSWGFECDRDEFRSAIEAVREGGVHTRHRKPQWVGYWSFPVRDPMGNTVEITTARRESWP